MANQYRHLGFKIVDTTEFIDSEFVDKSVTKFMPKSYSFTIEAKWKIAWYKRLYYKLIYPIVQRINGLPCIIKYGKRTFKARIWWIPILKIRKLWYNEILTNPDGGEERNENRL